MEREVKLARFLKMIGVLWPMMLFMLNCLCQQALPGDSRRESALAFEHEGKVADAEAGWRSVLSSQPKSSEAYAHLGLLEARQEHYKEAIVDYHRR